MIELIALALAGCALAGLWDLRTTEVPDEIPALMIAFGLFALYMRAAALGEMANFAVSLVVGTLLLAFGLLMYWKSQWGEADAWILAAVGYLVPVYGGQLFMLSYVPNFLIVSAAYMIIYALALGAMNPGIFSYVPAEFKAMKKTAALLLVIFAIPAAAFWYAASFSNTATVAASFAMLAVLLVFMVYAKTIEKHAFRKKIPAARLKTGDVLEKMVWRGLTADEVSKIKSKGGYVVIKEGVRFVPVFFLTLVVTLLWGNLLFAFFAL